MKILSARCLCVLVLVCAISDALQNGRNSRVFLLTEVETSHIAHVHWCNSFHQTGCLSIKRFVFFFDGEDTDDGDVFETLF